MLSSDRVGQRKEKVRLSVNIHWLMLTVETNHSEGENLYSSTEAGMKELPNVSRGTCKGYPVIFLLNNWNKIVWSVCIIAKTIKIPLYKCLHCPLILSRVSSNDDLPPPSPTLL